MSILKIFNKVRREKVAETIAFLKDEYSEVVACGLPPTKSTMMQIAHLVEQNGHTLGLCIASKMGKSAVRLCLAEKHEEDMELDGKRYKTAE